MLSELQTGLYSTSCCAGAVLVIVIVFMAVTSSGASEMVAISSLFTFDVYRRYIDPKVSGSSLPLQCCRSYCPLCQACGIPER